MANVVLNTHFLNLILKLMKSAATYGGGATGATSSSSAAASRTGSGNNNGVGGGGTHSTLVATMNSNAQQGRVAAATVLAMMLRYATVLQPPTIRAREEHIVASIVSLLNENVKMDVRFKRRAVAALGETVFYISAQDESTTTGVGAGPEGDMSDRWVLPAQAVTALIDIVHNESDEIAKHYAVKVSQNHHQLMNA